VKDVANMNGFDETLLNEGTNSFKMLCIFSLLPSLLFLQPSIVFNTVLSYIPGKVFMIGFMTFLSDSLCIENV